MIAQIPQVTLPEAKNFAQKWNFNGLTIPMDDVHLKFATDFANCVLVSFIQHCQQRAFIESKAKEKLSQEENEKHKIVLTGE
jgi:hypothetical protein